MIGPAIAVEKLPLAPMIANKSAPPRGNRSDVMPSIVGHQNATPAANRVAAANAAPGLSARLNMYRPAAAGAAVTAMSAIGETACAAFAPNCRNRYITPLIHTTTRIPACVELLITRLNMVGIQLPGPSSVAAVLHS